MINKNAATIQGGKIATAETIYSIFACKVKADLPFYALICYSSSVSLTKGKEIPTVLVYIDVPDTPEKSTVIPLFDYLNGEKGADTYSISNTWHFLESRRTETGKGRHVANWFGYNMSPRSFDIVVVGFGPGLDPTDLLTMVGKRDTSLGVLLSAAINSNAIAVCSPDQYKTVLAELETNGGVSPEVRRKFAGRALRYMARLYKMLAGTILQTNSDSNG